MWKRVVQVYQDIKEGDEQDRLRRESFYSPKKSENDLLENAETIVADITMFNTIPDAPSALPYVFVPETMVKRFVTQIPIFYQDGKLMPLDTDLKDVLVTHCELVPSACNVPNAVIRMKLGEHQEQQIRIRESLECSRPLVLSSKAHENLENILCTKITPLLHYSTETHDYWNRNFESLLTLLEYCHFHKEREMVYQAIIDHCDTDYIIPRETSAKILAWNRMKRTPAKLNTDLQVVAPQDIEFKGELFIEFIELDRASGISVGYV